METSVTSKRGNNEVNNKGIISLNYSNYSTSKSVNIIFIKKHYNTTQCHNIFKSNFRRVALVKILKDCTYRNSGPEAKHLPFVGLLLKKDFNNPTKYHFRPSRLSHKLITSLVQTIEHSTALLSASLQQRWTMCQGEWRCEEVFPWPRCMKGGSWVWLFVSTLSLPVLLAVANWLSPWMPLFVTLHFCYGHVSIVIHVVFQPVCSTFIFLTERQVLQ